MSKASSAIKVLRTALKRVQKGWTKKNWHYYDPYTGVNKVCLEGALFGYCEPYKHGVTAEQIKARNVCLQIIHERYPAYDSIPAFNDAEERTQDEVMEVIKLGIIRLETGGDEDGLDDEDVEDLLEFMDKPKG